MHKHFKQQALSFRHALNGIAWTFRTQSHFQFHFLVALFVMAAALYLGLSFVELALLVFTICLVLAVETLNTAIEALVDNATTEWHGYAKVAKDVSAGAVLLVSMGAAFVGFFIFFPHIIVMLTF